jgi:ABC-type sugar transport system substrate-binding protein
MRTVALLLEDEQNRYQQMLGQEARASARRLGITVLDPEFAEGSSWTQIQSVNAHLRGAAPPDALLIVLAGEQYTRPAFERVVKRGVALVFLNRIPEWFPDLRRDFPEAFVLGVAPNQGRIGQIQARQASRLVRSGAFVLLVTGAAASVTAVERTRGFLESVKDRFTVQSLDGRWSTERARGALAGWFLLGADRDRPIDLVVCQNDAMARGARQALAEEATRSGRSELERVPVIGCDGLEDEGQALVNRGELAATVAVPTTAIAALEALGRYWDHGERSEQILLDSASFPSLESLSHRR